MVRRCHTKNHGRSVPPISHGEEQLVNDAKRIKSYDIEIRRSHDIKIRRIPGGLAGNPERGSGAYRIRSRRHRRAATYDSVDGVFKLSSGLLGGTGSLEQHAATNKAAQHACWEPFHWSIFSHALDLQTPSTSTRHTVTFC